MIPIYRNISGLRRIRQRNNKNQVDFSHRERKENMEIYEKPQMEILEISNTVTTTSSSCTWGGGNEGNEGPATDCAMEF